MANMNYTALLGGNVIGRGANSVFRGFATPTTHLGVHRIGRLCQSCEDGEIAAYYERLYSKGRRRPGTAAFTRAQAKEADTCGCNADLANPYCFRDRTEMINDVQMTSFDNAGPGEWLEHLELNPNTHKAQYVQTPALYAALQARRWLVFEPNACRCGEDIPLGGAVGPTGIPVPVTMCTACNGIIIDVNHARVVNWQNQGRTARGQSKEKNMLLNRRVPRI